MEHGGTRCISKDVLKKLIEKSTPREWLQGQDSTKEYLLQFLVSYAICSAPKEDTKSALSDLATKGGRRQGICMVLKRMPNTTLHVCWMS